jgi:lipopolysaccharide transport system ATP-binding protein
MSNDVLIRVDSVSKKFCRRLRKSLWYGIQDMAAEVFGGSRDHDELRSDEFWAVKDVSFELRRGECLGLIGHNGAGKTTLLKMLNGLIKPDHGSITMRGRVGALIALGAGFNPILTGRENIYVNASVLGINREEIDRKIPEIIGFAGIGDFIDAPVQNYSSGMQVRLGFAVATALDPEILILDEVLAVGDIGFQIKCGQRIRSMARNAAVIFVSHSMQYVSLFCTRVIVMKEGCVGLHTSNPAEGIQAYFALSPNQMEVSGTKRAEVLRLELRKDGNACRMVDGSPCIRTDDDITISLLLRIDVAHPASKLRINILNEGLDAIISFPVWFQGQSQGHLPSGVHRIEVHLGPLHLNMGKYSILVAVTDAGTEEVLLRHQGLCPFNVESDNMHSASRLVRRVDGQLAAAPASEAHGGTVQQDGL